MRSGTIILLLNFSILALFSCGKSSDKSESRTNIVRVQKQAVKVKLGTAEILSDKSYMTVSGKIEADVQSKISARIMGYITQINAKVGNRVSKGQSLIRIKNNEVQAKYAQVNASIAEARAALSNIEGDYNRMKRLFEQRSITRKQWEDTEAQYKMAQARVDAAESMRAEVEEMMTFASITSPISGIVTQKLANVGEMASPGMPLLIIESRGSLRVVALIPENHIQNINIGDEVNIRIKSSEQDLKGEIIEIAPSSQMTGSQFEVKIKIEKSKDKTALFSGMYATVQIPLPEGYDTVEDRLTIPSSSVVEYGQLSGVYTIAHDSTAILRWLRLGKEIGDQVEVLSGLAKGEQYVLSANGKVENGSPLIIDN